MRGFITRSSRGEKMAAVLASRPENREKTTVALLPDPGGRYLSTLLFRSDQKTDFARVESGCECGKRMKE